jgi:hypothetical protein
MSTAAKTRISSAASAAVISSVGLLACLAPAQALPCKQYGFPGKVVIIEEGTGWTVSFSLTGTSSLGQATARNSKDGSTRIGKINGVITEHNFVMLIIDYPKADGDAQGYQGYVGNDGKPRGSTTYYRGVNWTTQSPFSCIKE